MPQGPEPQNQRKTPRTKLPSPGHAALKSEGGLVDKGRGLILDWSEGGAQVVAVKEIKAGERLLMVFALPSGEDFDLRGKVRWVVHESMAWRFGMEFENLTPSRLKHLHELLMPPPAVHADPLQAGLKARRHARVQAPHPIHAQLRTEGGLADRGRATLLDASRSGALMESSEKIHSGERLLMEFRLANDSGTFDIRGKVRWVIQGASIWRFGFEWESHTPLKLEHLQALLRQAGATGAL